MTLPRAVASLVVGEGTAEPPTRQVERVAEYGEVRVPLDLLMRDGVFDVRLQSDQFELRFRGREVVVRASHYVGQIAVNDRLILEVVPRVSIEGLDRILRVSGHVPIQAIALTRAYALSRDPLPSLLDVVARSMLTALQPIHIYGLYRRYERHEDDTSFPRGRILVGQTIARHVTRGHAMAAVSYFEHSRDNGPNRTLKLALWQIAALIRDRGASKGSMLLLSQLNAASRLFEDVDLDFSASFVRDPEVAEPQRIPIARDYYRPAIELAKFVIQRSGIDFESQGADIVLPSLLIDLQDAFERYIRNVLGLRIGEKAHGVSVMDGNVRAPTGGAKPLFDSSPSVDANPDIVIRGQRGSSVLGEVKYIDRNFSREEINQAIAYSASYGAPCVLIKPRRHGEVPGLHKHGDIAGFRIYRYYFDLGENLERQERLFAGAMTDLLKTTEARR